LSNILKKKLLHEQLDNIDVVHIAADLVQIPSYTFLKEQEKETALYIQRLFKKEDIPVTLLEVENGRYNVVAVLKGKGGGKSLTLSGHLDTVPAYDMKNAFSGKVADGKLYGRGSCDMKGPLAAQIAAIIGIKRAGIELAGDLYFTGVIDEEEKGRGIGYLVKNGPFTNATIVGEPTSMHIAIGHKGLEWIKIQVYGKQVHGGRMDEGINAIYMASRLIEKIYEEYAPFIAKRTHPILGHATINVGRIIGGDQLSTVPGNCTIEIDRRWMPEESIEQVYYELNELIKNLSQKDNRFHAEVKSYYNPASLLPHKPFCTAIDDPIVLAALSVLTQRGDFKDEEAFTERIQLTSFPAWSDAGMLASKTDTKCIILGPGNLALAHSSEESIEVKELIEAAEIYALLAMEYCGI